MLWRDIKKEHMLKHTMFYFFNTNILHLFKYKFDIMVC